MNEKGLTLTDKQLEGFEVLIAIALIPVILLAAAFTVQHLWAWFAVPLGLPAISMSHAYGLSILIGTMAKQRDCEKPKKSPLKSLGDTLVYCGLGLLFGYVAHRIMIG
jgi:hypothetical protein